MALAIAKAGPLRPEIRLSQALQEYEAVLSVEERQSYKTVAPDTTAVMALTCEVDRKNAGRRTRRCGARLTSFLNSVQGFTTVVGLIVYGTGNPIAGAVWGAVRAAVQAASGFQNYFDQLSTMLMNLGPNSPRIEKYALLYPDCPGLQKELCNYFAVVVGLCTRILLFVKKPVVRQVASALRKPFDDEFGSFQKDLNRLGAAVREEVSIASKQKQSKDSAEAARERKENSLFRATGAVFRRETAYELAQSRKRRDETLKSRFLNNCSRYNMETALNQARKKGASTWMYDAHEYQEWKSAKASSVLQCSGIMGCGKTVLCASIVEDLALKRPANSLIGYFFCRYDEAISLKAREIIGGLARQLLQNFPINALNLDSMDASVGDTTFNTEQVLSKILLRLPHNKQYILVIDGLEECDREEISLVLETVKPLLKSPEHIFKLFWTSRFDAASILSEQVRPDFKIHISSSKNGPEISSYIDYALQEALESGRLKLRNPEIILRIQEALVAEAQDMFLWVAFQIISICAQNTDNEILDSLKHLPRGLPATFKRILHQMSGAPFARPSLAKRMFEIAMSITPGDTTWNQGKLINDVHKLLQHCGSFLVIDEELSTVHFPHASVRRYLISSPDTDDVSSRAYHFDERDASINLREIIVTYLNLDVLGAQIAKTSKSPQPYAVSLPSHVVESVLPRHDVVSRAIKLSKSRKSAEHGPALDLGRSTALLREDIQVQETFIFLPYCQEHWLDHSSYPDNTETSQLWENIVYGRVKSIDLPWAPDSLSDPGAVFIRWIDANPHSALLRKAIERVWYYIAPNYVDHVKYLDYVALHTDRLAQLLNMWKEKYTEYSLNLKASQFTEDLLVRAATAGHEVVVNAALFSLDTTDNCFMAKARALSKALEHQNTTIAKTLIDEGADVGILEPRSSNLQVAVSSKGLESVVEHLIKKGADVNECFRDGSFALTAAARANSHENIGSLLKAGADINAKEEGGYTALQEVICNGNMTIMDLLMKAGANVNFPEDHASRKPLLIATQENNTSAVSRLLEAGAAVWSYDIDTVDSPLKIAAKVRNQRIVTELLAKGARIWIHDFPLKTEKHFMKEWDTTRAIATILVNHQDVVKPVSWKVF